jgi:site-specific DNA-methyltransferase (cytosine-N4-specific)
MKNIIKIETGSLEVHPLAAAVICQTKKSGPHGFTMENFGQVQPISIVMRDDKPLIIDGVERWKIAKLKPALFPELDCRILEINDDDIVNRRILLNSNRKQSIREKCHLIESVLNMLGKTPGVKREMIEKLELKHSSKIKLDRYHFACHIADVDYSASTLRKLMTIYNSDDAKNKDRLLDLVDSGETTIDKAFKVLNSKAKKIKEANMLRKNHFGTGVKGTYKLYNKSSYDMSEIEDESIQLFIFSPPYWILRMYRNQGLTPFGRENTVEEYIENLMSFIREIRKKLKKNGVMVIILGETYREGYRGICTKAETAIEKDGWKIKDVNIWVKKNPKYATHPSRFMNGYERVIVACPTDEAPVFNPIKKPSAIGEFKVIKSCELVNCNRNFSMASPEADITNVLITSVFNKKEHSVIDNEFSHDAPAPEEIYETFIKAYSMPGDKIVDGFIGGGSVGVGLKLGRHVIGFDIDPTSIDFCQKRFKAILGEDAETLSIAA